MLKISHFSLKIQALGCGCVGQAVLSRGAHGGTMTVSVGFAMAVTIAVYVSGGVSGKYPLPSDTVFITAIFKLAY